MLGVTPVLQYASANQKPQSANPINYSNEAYFNLFIQEKHV